MAELLLYNDKEKVTTGASNDIERATDIIKQIVSNYGMTEKFGLLNLNQLNIDNKTISDEQIKIAKELENETLEILTKNKDKLRKQSHSPLLWK